MRLPWFRVTGLFYIPVSFPGWMIFIGAVAFAVFSFIDIDSKSHSVSDTLMNFAFRLLIIAVIYSVIGYLSNGLTGKK